MEIKENGTLVDMMLEYLVVVTLTLENRRDLDPNRVNNNYRLKNNYFEPYANYGNWFMTQMGQSSSKGAYWADLRTGKSLVHKIVRSVTAEISVQLGMVLVWVA